jgi:RNA polymerase sigma-70 factor, ECF subfamily
VNFQQNSSAVPVHWQILPPSSSAIIAEYRNMQTPKGEITLLLERLSAGDRSAEDTLMPRVYLELHRIAQSHLRFERANHTLQATDLVNEAYLRLCRHDPVAWQDRAHFFRIAARQIRRILVDYARRRNAQKRGDGQVPTFLDEGLIISESHLSTTLEIDDLLEKLAELSPRQAQVVEMRFFAGLSEAEIAAVLHIHPRTVKRDWFMARAWLHQHLKGS